MALNYICCRFLDSLTCQKQTIANTSLHIEQLIDHFNNWDQFSIADITEFYQRFDPAIKRSTVDWRIHKLKNEGIIQNVGRGQYSLESKAIYTPGITSSIKRIYNMVQRKYPYLEMNIWDSRWLNEFMIQQPARFYTLVEVDKEAMQPVFYFLRDTKSEVYLDPTSSILHQYARDTEAIIITNFVTEAPTQVIEKITTATLEKILVDIYCNQATFMLIRAMK